MTEISKLNQQALDILFNDARTHSAWLDKDVPDSLLKQIYDLTKMAPSSANCQPLRVHFVKSKEAKARLKPLLAEGNVEKTMTAPVVAILAKDMEFYEQLPRLFPHTDARSWFAGKPEAIEYTATQNSNIQAGYFILAARSLGLDCGPMAGFDKDGVDKEFLKGTKQKSIVLINLGHGDTSKLHPRSPRPEFSEFCEIL